MQFIKPDISSICVGLGVIGIFVPLLPTSYNFV